MTSRALHRVVPRILRGLGVVFALLVCLGGNVISIAAGDWIVDSACCCPSPADCDCDPDHRDGDASLDACGNSGHATGWELDIVAAPARVELTWRLPRGAVIRHATPVTPSQRDLREHAKPG
jgi:hypothetical protein